VESVPFVPQGAQADRILDARHIQGLRRRLAGHTGDGACCTASELKRMRLHDVPCLRMVDIS